MSQPTDRSSFITYCRQRLGEPVINIELSPGQSDQAVDDALTKFREYHYNATQRTYLKHAITIDDLTNKWIPVDPTIMDVMSLVMCNEANLNIFDVRYQLRLQDFYNFSNVSMTNYVITMEKLALMDFLLNPQPRIEFNRFSNKLYINTDWTQVQLGQFFVFEVYQMMDETLYPAIWQDGWLKNYATALMHRQWGSNLKKFRGINTLGNATLDGQQVYDEAVAEIEKLESQLYRDYQQPLRIFIG